VREGHAPEAAKYGASIVLTAMTCADCTPPAAAAGNYFMPYPALWHEYVQRSSLPFGLLSVYYAYSDSVGSGKRGRWQGEGGSGYGPFGQRP